MIARISATAISTLSVPIPVETTETRWPRYVPVTEANSRCRCSSSIESKRAAIRVVRSWSPGRRMYSARSPGPSPMWYCRSPSGSRSCDRGGFRRGYPRSARPLPRSCGVLRWRETRPRIVPPIRERQAEWTPSSPSVGHAQPTLGPRSAQVGRPGRRRRAVAGRPGTDDAGQSVGHPALPRTRARRRRRSGHGDRRDADEEHRRKTRAGARQPGDRVAEGGRPDEPPASVVVGRRGRARRGGGGSPRSAPRTTVGGVGDDHDERRRRGPRRCR